MRLPRLSAILVVTVTTVAYGQIVRGQLKATKATRTQVTATAIIQPVRCDSNNSVYVRPHSSVGVVRISNDGQTVTNFSLKSLNVPKPALLDFAVDSNGEVYLLGEAPEPQVLVFSNDGSFKKKIVLDADIWPRQLALFRNGEMVIFGRRRSTDGAEAVPFAAIFNSAGQLMRHLDVPYSGPETAAGGSGNSAKEHDQMGGVKWLSLSVAEAADDGNVYLSRPGPNGPIIVLSPSGEVVKILRPRGPEDAALTSVKASGGRVAVLFISSSANPISTGIIQVLNGTTDEIVGEYTLTPELGLGLACFAPGEFRFIRGGQALEIVSAEPQ